MTQADAIFSKSTCDSCGYKHATDNKAKDGSATFFICERCGYQKSQAGKDEPLEMRGIGSFSFVAESGIVAGGVYMDEAFYGNLDNMAKAVQGADLFYTLKRDDKFYLIRHKDKKEWEFGVDDIICLDGLKKSDAPSGNLKVSYSKKD